MDQDDDIIDEQDESPVEIVADESSSDSSIPSDVEFSEEPLNRGTTSEEINIPSHNSSPVNYNRQPNNRAGSPLGHQRPDLGAKPSNNRPDNQNKTNHQRPNLGAQTKEQENNKNESHSNDVGSRNLRKSLSDQTKKMWNKRKNKKKKEEQSSSSSSESDSTDDSSSSSVGDDIKKLHALKVKMRRIKIIVSVALIGFLLLFGVAIICAILGIDISSAIPAINQGTYGTENFTPTYEEGTDEYKEEIAYYEKLKEACEEYAKENGEDIKSSYIHSVLIYLYYQVDDLNIENETLPVDYKKMTSMIDKIIELIKPSDSNDTIDYEIKGEFYNKLKESQDFKDYYEKVLKDKDIDELLEEIFNFASELDELQNEDDSVITDETEVTVTSSESSDSKPRKLSVNEYLAESIYAKTESLSNSELVKAYTVVYSTNIVHNNKNLTIDSNSASMDNDVCSLSAGCSYNKDGQLVEGPGERSSKNTYYYNGQYYYRKPLSSSETTNLKSNVSSVFGNVLVKSDGTYPSVNPSQLSTGGFGDYKTMLNNSYSDYTIKDIGENSYVPEASYGDRKVQIQVKFYDQSDYSAYSFCGLKKETIASSGCGVTAMAIVVSTYENNNKYDPIWANEIARTNGQCGAGSGTDLSHFKYVANKMGYKNPIIYQKGKANNWKLPQSAYNNVLNHLSKGNLVIVNVTKGHFTSGGHYIVLAGVDPSSKKVYVYDPNNNYNSSKRKTGTGWWSFNDIIAPESKNIIIIERKG